MSSKLKKNGKKIVIALILYGIVLLFEHFGSAVGIPRTVAENRVLIMGLYLVPFLIAGWSVVKNAVLGIVHRQMFDEALLMTIASIGAFATGESAEACAVMLFYQVGEWFQQYALGKSRGSITELMDIAPEEAEIEQADGTTKTIDPSDVRVGDILVIRPGEKIPVDASVVSGTSRINTAALTGESVPRTVNPGDAVISGCVNGEGLLKARADKQYEDSTVAKILELVENASSKKSRTENFITRFARWYTPIVVFGAIALAVIPSILFGSPKTWIYRACTFLVISCPCALVISVPLAFFGGIGAASKTGVLVKGSNYLEWMGQVATVVSDKTGTLTKGEFRVNQVLPAEGFTEADVLRAAAVCENGSTHPIAAAVMEAVTDMPDPKQITETENESGKGIRAVYDGRHYAAGNALLMTECGVTVPEGDRAGATVVFAAEENRFVGEIRISDTVKPEAAEAVRSMKREGVRKFVMLTGDRKETAEAVAAVTDVDEVRAELLPEQKVQAVEQEIEELRREGSGESRKRLAFIGDGINDAPVLMRSDVGIAMGSMGSDAAIEAADIVIMDDDLRRIPVVIRIARRTVRIAYQNIVFALAVKFLILVLGGLGIANMWAAVFSDVGVAVLCILNSMRMLKTQDPDMVLKKNTDPV